MNLGLRKILSVVIVILTALGIILSLFLIFEVWHYRLPATQKLQSSLDQFSSILQITDDSLVITDQVIKNVYTSTIYLNDATNAFSITVQSSSKFMDTAGMFVGDNLVTTITNTQTALGAAQASAKVIDNILSTLSKVPLIGITYNPAVPLNKSLGDVSSSLDPLKSNLKDFQTNLEITRNNMEQFSTEISVLDKNILTIQNNLEQAQATINNYRSEVTTMQNWAKDAKINLPTWTSLLAWGITLIIGWLIIIQITIMLQGIAQFSSHDFLQSKTSNPL